MRLGIINFLNSAPYREVGASFETFLAPPKALKKELLEGNLEASLVSVAAFLEHRDKLDPLPFGIACRGPVQSVLLFLKEPIETTDDLTLAVTDASETGVLLLSILLKHYWKKRFSLFSSTKPEKETASGYLLIGDEALEHTSSASFFVYDLAAAWKSFSGLPFIFAIFAIRKGHDAKALLEALSLSLDNFSKTLPSSPNKHYLSSFDYALKDFHFKGLDLFHALRQKLAREH